MGLIDISQSILKAVGIGIFICILIVFATGFLAGHYLTGQSAKQYEQFAIDKQMENNGLEELLRTLDLERNELSDQVDILEIQKAELEKSVRTLSDDNVRLRTELSAVRAEKYQLEMYKTLYEAKSTAQSTAISTNTPAQNEQKTVSYATATKYEPSFSYPPYHNRADTAFPYIYAGVTPNVEDFCRGKDFNGTVNAIRALTYILHGEVDGDNTIIQYADETLVRGKGDCTDKTLLLYACLRHMGYGEQNLFVASIHSCDGQYDHNVLLMTDPPLDKENYGHFSFTLKGVTYYIIDPTNWAGTPMNSGLSYYDDCYVIGNIHSFGSTDIYGIDDVPMHGLKVTR